MNTTYDSIDYSFLSNGILLAIALGALIITFLFYLLTAYIFWVMSKTNGFEESAYISWIPIANVYNLFLLGSKGDSIPERRKNAKLWFWIYIGSSILALIPVIGWVFSLVGLVLYVYAYYLLYLRWTGEKNKSILFDVATIFTGGLFFLIYGLINMKRPFIS